ncbi:hypothetical protein P7C73_g5448, partial [Tremellales sp. Uapishka_1]
MASPDAILHLAALHALSAAGFASTSNAASVTLSTALAQYLKLLATNCVERAALAGRSKVNAGDVVTTLDELGMGGVGELQEWALDLEGEVVFAGGGMEVLAAGLRIENGLDLTYMPVKEGYGAEEKEDEDDEDEDNEDEDGKEDETMEVDREVKVETLAFPSPDYSWLPPLPSAAGQAAAKITTSTSTGTTASTAPQTIAERYLVPILYANSQLSQTHPFVSPPKPTRRPLPPAPSSLQSLITTYEQTASDPSVTIRQTETRRHAADMLRLGISTPDSFSPETTLSLPIPPPRCTPIVPTYSDTLPQKLLLVNPRPDGLLSSLLHQTRSLHLPPSLRERLTSLRPPQPLNSDSGPIFYGESVRGPDEAALAKARGKPPTTEEEGWARATWDSGPRGMVKWSRGRLPSGRKVVQSGVGEDKPREPEGVKEEAVSGIKLRLGGPRLSVGRGEGTQRTSVSPEKRTAVGGEETRTVGDEADAVDEAAKDIVMEDVGTEQPELSVQGPAKGEMAAVVEGVESVMQP